MEVGAIWALVAIGLSSWAFVGGMSFALLGRLFNSESSFIRNGWKSAGKWLLFSICAFVFCIVFKI